MQTARVTILMTPDKKAAFDAVATERGQSVGEFFRQAGDKAAGELGVDGMTAQEAVAMELLASALEATIPEMKEDLDAITATLRHVNEAMEAYRAEKRMRSAA